jgi:hypothetical protein
LFAACEDEQRTVCGTVADCPGDPTCTAIACSGHICTYQNVADGSAALIDPAGDCRKVTCDGIGGFYVNNDDTDLPAVSGACTTARCTDGVASTPPAQAGTDCGNGLVCDNTGSCVGCVGPLQCPGGPDTECHARTCVNESCGVTNTADNTKLVNGNPKGDCHQIECDGTGGTKDVIDDTDIATAPSVCVVKGCSSGTATSVNQPLGFACGTSSSPKVCNGSGICGQCNVATDCPGGPDTDCHVRTCVSNVCGIQNTAIGTPTVSNPAQVPGDCHQLECNGSGGTNNPVFDGDVPDDSNSCTTDTCSGGVGSNTGLADGTSCSDSGSPGTRCRSSACVPAFAVVRVGDTTTALSSASFPLQIEERYASDGASVTETSNPVALPTAASGTSAACTNAGLAGGSGGQPPLEGFLVRSVDEHYVTLACYDAAPATAAISGTMTSATNRVVARVDNTRAVDTTTKLDVAFNQNSVRSVVSTNGTDLWIGGSGATTTGGTWYTTLGTTTGAVSVNGTPSTNRCVHIFGGQLYGTSGAPTGFPNVFAIGSGEPTTTGQTAAGLAGMPTGTGATNNPLDYVILNPGPGGVETLYLTDNRAAASSGGIQKWTTSDGTTWTLANTFDGLTPGMYGITAYMSGGNAIILATSNTVAGNLVVSYTDDNASTPSPTTLATAPANTGYRGIALAPH